MKPNTYLLEDDFKELERILRDGTTPQDWEHAKMLYFFINTKIQNSRFSPEPYQITPQQEHILETYRQKKKDEHPIIDKKVPLPLLSKVLLISFVAIFLIGAIIAYARYTAKVKPIADEKIIANAQKALKFLPINSIITSFSPKYTELTLKIRTELITQISLYKKQPTEDNKEKLEKKTQELLCTIYPPILHISYQEQDNNKDIVILMEDNAKYDLRKVKEIRMLSLSLFYFDEIQFSYCIFNKNIPKIKHKILGNFFETTEVIKDYQAGNYTIEIYVDVDNQQISVKKINFTLY